MRRENDQALGEVLREWLAKSPIKSKLYQARVAEVWKKQMGPTINQYTTEIRLTRKKLFLTITSASLRQELSYSRDKIRDMINEELGEEVVTEVVVSG